VEQLQVLLQPHSKSDFFSLNFLFVKVLMPFVATFQNYRINFNFMWNSKSRSVMSFYTSLRLS
jgi:hypothetical protein